MSTPSHPGSENPFGAPTAPPPGYWTGPRYRQRKPPMAGWKLGLIITFGTIGGLVLLMVVFGLLYHFGQTKQTVHARDRAVMLTADKVKQHFEIVIDSKHETIKKVKHFDDTYELTYDYDLPDGLEGKSALIIQCNLTIDKNRADAVTNYHATRLGMKAGLYKEGMTETVANDRFRWGDTSRFSYATKDGEVQFYMFQARKGVKVWSLVISGIRLESAETVKALLSDTLEAVGDYTP